MKRLLLISMLLIGITLASDTDIDAEDGSDRMVRRRRSRKILNHSKWKVLMRKLSIRNSQSSHLLTTNITVQHISMKRGEIPLLSTYRK